MQVIKVSLVRNVAAGLEHHISSGNQAHGSISIGTTYYGYGFDSAVHVRQCKGAIPCRSHQAEREHLCSVEKNGRRCVDVPK